MASYIDVMLEIMLMVGVAALVAWRFLEYLDGMGQLHKKLRRDAFVQIQYKSLANNSNEGKFTCVKCTHIKEKNERHIRF